MIVTIIGLGLIGGSLALDLKARGFTNKVIGVEKNKHHVQLALRRGLVDEILELKEAVEKANLVILAVPVNVSIQLLNKVLDYADDYTTITDMGSTKAQLLTAIEEHPNRANFVASHPMAGTEYSGPTAAIYNLFDNRVAIICDKENSHPEALTIVESMYKTLNMRPLYMCAKEHDMHAAYVSHISHITSFALANAVLDKEKSVNTIFNLASGGFASTVRLAKSSPQMWSQIFEQNTENVLEVLTSYITHLQKWKGYLETGQFDAIEQAIGEANRIRKVLG